MAKEKGRGREKQAVGMDWMIKRFVAVFATIMVVVGVATVGYLARDTMEEIKQDITQATSTIVYAPGIIVLNSDGARLFDDKGGFIRVLAWPDDTAIFDKPLSQIKGIDANTGKDVWFGHGFSAATGTKFRSPDGRREAFLRPERADGSRPLVVTYGNDEDTIILRDQGEIIREIEILGWRNDKAVVFTGLASAGKMAYVWELGLETKPIGEIKGDAYNFKVFEDAIYYLSSEMIKEDGREFRAAPASFYSLSYEGETSEIAKEDDSVIIKYALGDGLIVYEAADTSLFIKTALDIQKIGKGAPLLFIDDKSLIYTNGGKINIMDLEESREGVFLANSEKAAVFYLQKVRMDEKASN